MNLGVAKDQRLSLNPSQISGACGRLMCCLRYEHEFYVHSRKRFPKEGKVIRTARGDEKVISNDIFRERATLRGEDGELRVILTMQFGLKPRRPARRCRQSPRSRHRSRPTPMMKLISLSTTRCHSTPPSERVSLTSLTDEFAAVIARTPDMDLVPRSAHDGGGCHD